MKEVKRDKKDEARAKMMANNRGTGYEQMLKFVDFCEKRIHENMGAYWKKHQVGTMFEYETGR